MGLLLKQSTGVTVKIGPFVDEDDGKTAETGLTLTQPDIRLSKNGGNMAQKNDANAATHDEIGYYDCALDATDTNTLGRLQLMVHESGALPVYHEYMVVTANDYDSQCSTDYKQVDVIQVAGAGEDIATETKQDTIITDTNELQTDWTNGGRLDLLLDAVLADTGELQTDWANGGRLDLLLDATLADTNELQTDWANGGRLDLLIDGIKAITDLLVLADIADTIWDEVMDANAPANANTARKIINILVGVLAGKSSGGGTATLVFRDTGDTKNRLSETVDANGNRTAVGTLDGT